MGREGGPQGGNNEVGGTVALLQCCQGRPALGLLDSGYVVRSCGPSSPVRLSSSTVGLVGEQERGVD
jgi:hypothetical protein